MSAEDIMEIENDLYGSSLILDDGEYGEYIAALCWTWKSASFAGASPEFLEAMKKEMKEQHEYIKSDFEVVEEEVVRTYKVKKLRNIHDE